MITTNKYLKHISIILCMSIVLSCSKDSESMEDSKMPQLQFSIQGHGMKLFDSPIIILNDGIVRIDGLRSYNSEQDPWAISLSFPNSIGIHSIAKLTQDDIITTVFDGTICLEFFNNDCPPLPSYQAIEGSVSVTQSTGNKIKGTFRFTAENFNGTNKIIEAGKFEIEH